MQENWKILAGNKELLMQNMQLLETQPVDQQFNAPDNWQPPQYETTIAKPFSVTGPGTYSKGISRTLHFAPAVNGWSFNRSDLPEQFPINVMPENVWTAQRSIVLRSGSEHNYMRMVEHIIAQRLGMGLDNVQITMESGDPPLFNIGSLPIVEAIQNAGLKEDNTKPITYYTAAEPIAIIAPNGSFLCFVPGSNKRLTLDVAIDFPTAIGKQRIQFELCPDSFAYGAHARTNCPLHEMIYARTIGRLFADIRNLGYTKDNILIAGKSKYYNKPTMLHNGKSLEAVWHRACLDLVAALSLFNDGRLSGHVISYKAGHALDCRFMTLAKLNHIWKKL